MAKAKAASSAAARRSGGSKESLLVGSKVRAAIKEHGLNTSGDAIEGLNQWVSWLIQQAVARARANNRKTVRRADFVAGPGEWPSDD